MNNEIKNILLDFRDEVNNQFEQIDVGFEEVDERLKQIKNRFDNMDNRLELYEEMINQLINIVGTTKEKVKLHSEELEYIQLQMEFLSSQHSDIELAYEKITKNERDIAKLKRQLLE